MKQWSKILIKAKSVPTSNACNDNTRNIMGKKYNMSEKVLDVTEHIKDLVQKEG